MGTNAFIVAMGGSGAKVLESVIHMAALGTWKIDHIHALLVETDSGNGNMNRMQDTYKRYQTIQPLYKDCVPFFSTEITLYKWTPVRLDQLENNQLRGMLQDEPSAELLARLLYSEEELEHTIHVGFKGHPNLGVLFLSRLLRQASGEAEQELQAFIDRINDVRYDVDRVLIMGSCFGGTGAAGIPVIGQYLRKQITKKVDFGLFAILPTFSLRKPDDAANMDPDSNEFEDKVKTVLHAYLGENFWEEYEKPLYQQVYLLGSPVSIPYPEYATGRSAQENPATFFDWFACTGIAQFFEQQTVAPVGNYIGWLEQSPWDWHRFSPNVFPNLAGKVTVMMQVLGTYLQEVHLGIQKLPAVKKSTPIEVFFANVPSAQRHEVVSEAESFGYYAGSLVLWFYQILTNLPHDMSVEENKVNSIFHGLRKPKSADRWMESRDDSEAMAASLIRQRFFSALPILKMEERRREFWPRRDPETQQALDDPDLPLSLLQLSHDLRGKDLGSSLHRITGEALGARVDSGGAIQRACNEDPVTETDPKEAFRLLVHRLFTAVSDYHKA